MQIRWIIPGYYSNKLKIEIRLINDLLIYKYLSVGHGNSILTTTVILSFLPVGIVFTFL